MRRQLLLILGVLVAWLGIAVPTAGAADLATRSEPVSAYAYDFQLSSAPAANAVSERGPPPWDDLQNDYDAGSRGARSQAALQQRAGSVDMEFVVSQRAGVAANAGARTFGNFAMSDLRAAAQAADRNGLTQVGRALQKHSGRDGSVFNGLSSGSATARNEQGLRVLDDILNDPAGRTEVLDRVTNIWDSTGRGVRYGNDGSFMGFLEPVG